MAVCTWRRWGLLKCCPKAYLCRGSRWAGSTGAAGKGRWELCSCAGGEEELEPPLHQRATTVTMNLGNGRGTSATSAWWSMSKLPRLVNNKPVTVTARSRGSVSDLHCATFKGEENTWMKKKTVWWGRGQPVVRCICRCNVRVPSKMEAREANRGPRLLSKWSVCEDRGLD